MKTCTVTDDKKQQCGREMTKTATGLWICLTCDHPDIPTHETGTAAWQSYSRRRRGLTT